MPQTAIVLLSGGIDSQTCLALAKQQNDLCYALAIDYGQKHKAELESAARIAKHMQVALRLMKIDLGAMPNVALIDKNTQVPTADNHQTIKSTYVPARNTIFLSLALALAEVLAANKIYFGANLADFHGFPDTRPEYFTAFSQLANLATKAGVEKMQSISIETPLLKLDKKAIIELGLSLGVDYGLSTTCYQAEHAGFACGICDSCVIRSQAFSELGQADPINAL